MTSRNLAETRRLIVRQTLPPVPFLTILVEAIRLFRVDFSSVALHRSGILELTVLTTRIAPLERNRPMATEFATPVRTALPGASFLDAPKLCALARWRLFIHAVLACLSLATTVTADFASRWSAPSPAPLAGPFTLSPPALETAERSYAAAAEGEATGDPGCIDHYYRAASAAWPTYVATYANPGDRATVLYQASLRLMIATAERFGRFDPHRGVLLVSGQTVPVEYRGFHWEPSDFRNLIAVGDYSSSYLPTRYVTGGIGVSYVVLTPNARGRPFLRPGEPFGATALLAPSSRGEFSLQFYDPVRVATSNAGLPIARDLTAPLAYAASREGDAWLRNFLVAGRRSQRDGLYMREPFQPGKIPIVLVHGLASDPVTWSQLENILRAQPEILSRYQIWLFCYDTGGPFLSSAARLRRELHAIRQTYDPLHVDPALSRVVVIGHSMGGLVAKLQVTESGDALWQAAATRPLSTIVTDPATRTDLANAFYFSPSPDISRVVFIATPHRGSIFATRLIGRITSSMIEEPQAQRARHEQLIRDNPGAFRAELQQRIPTSIDLLEPDSPILQATARLCFRPDVALHTVLGDYEWTPGEGPSDGVVAVSSARLLGVRSELAVDAEHTDIQRRPETAREVMAILAAHAAEAPPVWLSQGSTSAQAPSR